MEVKAVELLCASALLVRQEVEAVQQPVLALTGESIIRYPPRFLLLTSRPDISVDIFRYQIYQIYSDIYVDIFRYLQIYSDISDILRLIRCLPCLACATQDTQHSR